MEYTVQKLSRLSGVSPRTLRYYHELGLLEPTRISSSGYRIYGASQVDRLQQILFYRELGLPLETIRDLMDAPGFEPAQALLSHRDNLMAQRDRLNTLITNVERTIASTEGRITMTDKEKFEGFKQKLVDDNEKKYGKEIRDKYGDKTVDASNQKLMGMTPETHAAFTRLTEELTATLAQAVETGDPAGDLAQKAAALHKEWLMFNWPEYTPEAHAGLGQMYVDDPRFKAYYDGERPGTAEFLRDAILVFTGMKK